MPEYKVVLQYTETDQGFQEVFYRLASDAAQAANFPSAFITAALRCRTPLVVLRKIRASRVTNNRDSVVVTINRNRLVSGQNAPDVTGTTAVCNLIGLGGVGTRRLWMRGLVDDDVQRNFQTGYDTPSPTLLQNIDLYIAQMATNQILIRSLQRLGTPPLVYTNIASVTVATVGKVTLNFVEPITITASGRIIVSQLDQKIYPGLVGSFPATVLTSTSVSIPYNSHLAAGTFPVTKGRSRPEEFNYSNINSDLSGFSHFGTRDTGKNPLGGRGRRSVRIRRSA